MSLSRVLATNFRHNLNYCVYFSHNMEHKTEVMCTSCKGNCRIILTDGQLVEQVSEFRHLGSLISEEGYFTKRYSNSNS